MANRFDIFVGALPAAEQKKTFKFCSFAFTSTLGVKGFQLLIDIWLKCLLTPVGSDPTDLSYGTVFTNLMGSSVKPEDARDVVMLAIEQCNRQIVSFQKADTSLTSTERFASGALIAYAPDSASPGFSATVELKNQAGERLQFLLPSQADV